MSEASRDKVLNLLESLSLLLEESKPSLTKSNVRQVDVDEAFDLLEEIRDCFPREFAEAATIVRERDAILDNAKDNAEQMIASAKDKSEQMLADAKSKAEVIASEQEIVKLAQEQADQIMADAQELEEKTMKAANDYAAEVFSHINGTLDALQRTASDAKASLNIVQ